MPAASAATDRRPAGLERELVGLRGRRYVQRTPPPARASASPACRGSWVQPTRQVHGLERSTRRSGSASAARARPDGALEQAGTEADCAAGGSGQLLRLVRAGAGGAGQARPRHPCRRPDVEPGDGQRQHRDGHRLADQTTGQSATKTLTMDNPDTSSAEWIAEAPSACDQTGSCSPLALTDFGTVTFTGASATATDGHTGTISDSNWSAAAVQLSPGASDPGMGGAQFVADRELGRRARRRASPVTARRSSVAWSAASAAQSAGSSDGRLGGGGYGGYGGYGYGGYGAGYGAGATDTAAMAAMAYGYGGGGGYGDGYGGVGAGRGVATDRGRRARARARTASSTVWRRAARQLVELHRGQLGRVGAGDPVDRRRRRSSGGSPPTARPRASGRRRRPRLRPRPPRRPASAPRRRGGAARSGAGASAAAGGRRSRGGGPARRPAAVGAPGFGAASRRLWGSGIAGPGAGSRRSCGRTRGPALGAPAVVLGCRRGRDPARRARSGRRPRAATTEGRARRRRRSRSGPDRRRGGPRRQGKTDQRSGHGVRHTRAGGNQTGVTARRILQIA